MFKPLSIYHETPTEKKRRDGNIFGLSKKQKKIVNQYWNVLLNRTFKTKKNEIKKLNENVPGQQFNWKIFIKYLGNIYSETSQ